LNQNSKPKGIPYDSVSSEIALGAEWAPRGVRVNAISPGFLDIPEAKRGTPAQSRRDMLLRRTPLGRFGDYPEIADAALFLASAGAGFITGQTLVVDGGYLAAGVD
jgi:NAD(P)-dependent dehydrogenase (short-subunit alcohol dehydrogenase family)